MEGNTTTETPKKRLPADLFSDEIPKTEKNPFDDKVKEKPYANIASDQPIDTPDQSPSSPPPAPVTEPTKASASEDKEFKSTPQPTPQADIPASDETPAEPAMTPEEIQSNAEQTVKLFFRFYEKIHTFGRWIGKIDKNDLANKHLKGEIDLQHQFQLEEDTITAGEFFKTSNDQIDSSIRVNEKFKEEFTPPAIRVCIKHGWLLSDEIYLGSLLFDDLSTKIGLLIGIRKSANDILESLITLQDKKKKQESNKTEKPKQTPEPKSESTIDEEWGVPTDESPDKLSKDEEAKEPEEQ